METEENCNWFTPMLHQCWATANHNHLWADKKTSSYQYKDSHYKDETL